MLDYACAGLHDYVYTSASRPRSRGALPCADHVPSPPLLRRLGPPHSPTPHVLLCAPRAESNCRPALHRRPLIHITNLQNVAVMWISRDTRYLPVGGYVQGGDGDDDEVRPIRHHRPAGRQHGMGAPCRVGPAAAGAPQARAAELKLGVGAQPPNCAQLPRRWCSPVAAHPRRC
jgi:hypothetical protein